MGGSDDDSVLGLGFCEHDQDLEEAADLSAPLGVRSHPLALTSIGSIGSMLLDAGSLAASNDTPSRSASPATFLPTHSMAAEPGGVGAAEEAGRGRPTGQDAASGAALPTLHEEPEALMGDHNEVR